MTNEKTERTFLNVIARLFVATNGLRVDSMLQLRKSIHLDSLRQPFKSAIVTAARLGADAVEINGMAEIRPDVMSRTAIRHVRKMLADLNLKVSAIDLPLRQGFGDLQNLDRRIEGTRAVMSLAFELGCNVVTTRIGKVPDDTEHPQWATLTQALSDIGIHSQKAGCWLAARTTQGSESMQALLQALPVHSLKIDFDPAELVINGHSPNDSIQSLAAHVVSCRARDAVTDLSLGRGVETTMGQGTVDWPSVLALLEQQNYQGYLTIQSSGQNILESCSDTIAYLEGLF